MGMNLSNLDAKVRATGLLIGILTESAGEFTLNPSWFGNAQGELTTLGTRLQYLAQLLDSTLGPAVVPDPNTLPPNMPAEALWYRIPNPATGTALPFYLVLVRGATSDAGQLGFGLLGTTVAGGLTAALSVFVPCWAYTSAGAQFVAGTGPSHPCLLSFTLSSDTGFAVSSQGVTFSGLNLTGSLYLDKTQPTFTLTFENLKGSPAISYNTLAPLAEAPVLAWVEAIIAQAGLNATSWLNTTLGSSGVTVGSILVAAGILSESNGTYAPAYDQFVGSTIDALGIAERFVFSMLTKLASSATPMLTLPGGGLYACAWPAASPTDYGLRAVLTVSASPQADVCLGTNLAGENADSNWLSASHADFPDPGISLYLLRAAADGTYSFAPRLILANVGVNLHGTAMAPLFDVNGYTLGDVEVRGALASPGSTAGSTNWPYGAAARFDGLGIPLGPGFDAAAGGTGANPVATSLLAAGSASGGGDQDPVNPTFSVSAAYVQEALTVQLYDQDSKPTSLVMLPLNRALGPLQGKKLGIGWLPNAPGPTLSLLFDGDVKLDVLDISLDELAIAVPLTSPGDFATYGLDLAGLGLSFSAGAVSLSGAFVKLPADDTATPPRPYPEYNGNVLVQAGTFSLAALGSYAYATDKQGQNGFASMFVFGTLSGTIGGPAFFFVTGLAAGFGYNRQLLLPTMSTVPDFPLVQLLSEAAPPTDPAAVLMRMASDVPPQRGEYWLAAGVNFTSFDLLKTSALLTVEFGQELEIALLGQTTLSLPPAPAGATKPVTYAYLELGVEVVVLPDTGSLAATALLTSNSYVIDPACKLTGGFALSSWFGDNPHAGEFVVTVGGYHPAFTPPSYYPSVPRLAFNWPVTSELTISGDAYFALTASAAMAGGGLSIVYSSGNLRAWFTAQMDALAYWAPFQYHLGMAVNLGASYKMDLGFTTVTLAAELGATLTVWGPPMGGTAYINWSVISFSIGFGAGQPASPQWLDWANSGNTGFAQTLLPHGASPGASPGPLLHQAARLEALATDRPAATASADSGVQPNGLYSLNVSNGLLQSFVGTNASPTLVLRPNHLCFSILTVVPTTQITACLNGRAQVLYSGPKTIPVRPVNTTLTSSVLTVQLTTGAAGEPQTFSDLFVTTAAVEPVPAAKWGPLLTSPAGAPELNALVAGQLLGLQTVQLQDAVLTPGGADLLQIDATKVFVIDPVADTLPLTAAPATDTPPVADATMLATIAQQLMAPDVVQLRQEIFVSLQRDFGLAAGTDGPLTVLAQHPAQFLAGNPLHG